LKHRFAVLTSLLAIALLAPAAQSQSFGQYGGAEPLPVNGRVFGVYLNASDNVVGILSQLRLSFYPGIDFGFQGGLARTDFGSSNKTTLRLGGDLKGLVSRAGEQGPLDVSVGGHLGVDIGDKYNVLRLGPTVFVSRTFVTEQGTGIVPYGSIGLTFARVSVGDTDETDFSFPIRFGAELRAMPEFRFLAELQVNAGDQTSDDVALVAGVNLPF
jgi:hypothetical protein